MNYNRESKKYIFLRKSIIIHIHKQNNSNKFCQNSKNEKKKIKFKK